MDEQCFPPWIPLRAQQCSPSKNCNRRVDWELHTCVLMATQGCDICFPLLKYDGAGGLPHLNVDGAVHNSRCC
jgi:hypothetical protein